MRKAQKEQICNFLELLKQAHEEIKKNIEKNNLSLMLGLLEDAQDGMIIIENLIEKAEGKHIVPMLERYCEMVYQIYEEVMRLSSEQEMVGFDNNYQTNQQFIVSDEKYEKDKSFIVSDKICQKREYLANTDKLYKDLKILLEQIENSIKNDIIAKQEVVFLPYKASMWDSLESVWKAADEDPNCDAYVIPIPYFDRNADGSFGELHYEGDLYPKYVPITHYEAFDFEEHRPDKIFIHNPYDEYNLVTSVHPNFYSKKLKEYTENLIYIPYFVLSEVDIENEEAVESMSHFCKVPAVLYADKVIVQSERMKQVYVKVLTKWQGEDTKQKWEEKILGLGSPKMDKVVNTEREDLEIPQEWQLIIQKSDGSNKKIVFYNTSLSAFLEHSDSYLKKIEDVLKVFQEAKEDVVLLWRPHPLMQSTMKSMRPEVAEQYIRIVQQYKEENWGIYDDTPDLDRAIGLADAYYGDPSSVVQLCQKVGMPVMIQDVEITYE